MSENMSEKRRAVLGVHYGVVDTTITCYFYENGRPVPAEDNQGIRLRRIYPTCEQSSAGEPIQRFLNEFAESLLAVDIKGIGYANAGRVAEGKDGQLIYRPWAVNPEIISEQCKLKDDDRPSVFKQDETLSYAWDLNFVPPGNICRIDRTPSPGDSQDMGYIRIGRRVKACLLERSGGLIVPGRLSEFGHAFCPSPNQDMQDYLAYLREKMPSCEISYEIACHMGRCASFYKETQPANEDSQLPTTFLDNPGDISNEKVLDLAEEGRLPACIKGVELFQHVLAILAGQFTLSTSAWGGVYIGGEIVSRLRFQKPKFNEAFLGVAPTASAGIIRTPVHLVSDSCPDAGAAYAAMIELGWVEQQAFTC